MRAITRSNNRLDLLPIDLLFGDRAELLAMQLELAPVLDHSVLDSPEAPVELFEAPVDLFEAAVHLLEAAVHLREASLHLLAEELGDPRQRPCPAP